MAKYIDAVSKAEVLETYAELYDVFDDYKEIKKELHKIYDKLNALPTADVVDKERYVRARENADILSDALSEYQSADMVEVVRCKDCVHHIDAPKTTDVWCERIDGLLQKDWFCADGERGTDDGEIH